MSNTEIIQVDQNFNLYELAGKITQTYRSKGFIVNEIPYNNGICLDLSKDKDGLKNIVGLSQGIRINITLNPNSTITVDYTNVDWTIKIIVLLVGLLLTFGCIGVALIITGVIGVVNQLTLPSKITADIRMFAAGASAYTNGSVPPYSNQNTQPNPNTICKNCGAQLPPASEFCTQCGTHR